MPTNQHEAVTVLIAAGFEIEAAAVQLRNAARSSNQVAAIQAYRDLSRLVAHVGAGLDVAFSSVTFDVVDAP